MLNPSIWHSVLSATSRYLLAIALYLVAFSLRWLALPVESGHTFLTFYPALVFGFYLCGTGPGLLITALSAATGYYIYLPPFWSFEPTPDRMTALAIFLLTSTLIGWVVSQSQTYLAYIDDFFTHSPTGMMAVDATNGRIVRANLALLDMLGYDIGEVLGQPIADFIFPDDLAAFKQHNLRPFVGAAKWRQLERRYRKKDGGYIIAEVHETCLKNTLGRPALTVSNIRDITTLRETQDKLELSKARYLALLQDQTEIICRYQTDGTILFVNDAFCRLVGKPYASLVGKKWHPEAWPEDLAFINRQLATLSPDNPVVTIENRVIAGDGTVRWSQFVNRAFFDGDGTLLEIQAVGRDITERKQAEAAHLEMYNRLNQIASRVPGVIYQFLLRADGSFCFPYASDAIQDIFRVTPEQVKDTAEPVFSRLHPDDYEGVFVSIRQSAKTLEPWRHECRICFEDGTITWISGNSIPTQLEDGSVLWHGFLRDCTERKHIEQKLRDLTVAIEQSPVSTVITDLDANIVYVNRHFTTVTGYSEAEVLGENPRILSSGLTPPETYPALWGTITQGSVWHGELINKKKNGDIYWEESHIAPVCNGQGTITHYVAGKLDITERKTMQRHLQESQEMFSTLFHESPVGIGISRLTDGVFIDVNDALLQIYGYLRDDIIGHTALELGLWVDPNHRGQVFAKILAQEAVINEDIGIRRQSGETITVMGSLYNILVAGEPCLIGFITDISGRKRMEQALRKESGKNQAFLMNASDGITIMDFDGKLVEVSDSFCTMLGYAREELLGQHVSLWDVGFKREELMPAVRQQFAKKGRSQFETLHRRKDGSLYDAEVSGFPVTIDGEWFLFNTTRDITARKALEKQLATSMQEVQDLYNHAPCGYHSLDREGVFVNINDTELEWLGYKREEVVGKKKITDFCTPAGQEQFRQMFPQFLDTGHVKNVGFELLGKDGHSRQVNISATAVYDGQGQFLKSRSVVHDITALKESERKIKLLAIEQQAMLDSALIGIAKLRGRKIIWNNRAIEHMFGYGQGELAGFETRMLYPDGAAFENFGKTAYPILMAHQIYRTQMPMRRKDGEKIWVDISGALLPGDGQDSIWMLSDVTLEHEHHDQIEHIAYHDILTGLPNRLLIDERLKQDLVEAMRSKQMLAVCYLDLDGFKPVNDTYGHEVGDQLLKEIAQRILHCVRVGDAVGRLGGDEFVLLLAGLKDAEEYHVVVQRVMEAINRPFIIQGSPPVHVGASIGIARFPTDGLDPDLLLRRADQAMYQAKQSGRNRVCLYHPDMPDGAS